MKHTIKFTEASKKELASLGKDVSDKVWEHFIKPIVKNGLTPPDELRGKYKPSWACDFVYSPMKQAFIANAEANNLHHYHFGFQYYKTGNDKDYPGEVSDGIIHSRIEVGEDVTTHVILQSCLEHPSPFKYPFERTNDKALDEQDAA
ncbi:hypothetical protein L1D11_10490 [Vibrio sp. Isolate32]|uniref:hypothetical protein n=1 Tax=Vibrio sp. Isolate32 TaxID=2908538 RepID=UPI001EFCD835|nr:hypothetical protein [Vibrio sp. Isolate32]MCG9553798.1 hypothetical protein [Vibrio sp. Isolate32]